MLLPRNFVAARDDEQGVLILSDFGGASRELSEALIVNPYDVYSVVESVGQPLRMSVAEQRERIRLMLDVVRSRNVYRWAGRMLLDASQLQEVDGPASASNHNGSGARERRRSSTHWTTSESESQGARSKGRAIS
jgi:trehalose 6-phosphate synthase